MDDNARWMEPVVLTARVRERTYERAFDLAPTAHADSRESRFDRLSIYLSPSEAVFVFQAPEPEPLLRRFLNDPVRAAELSPWLPLFDGPVHRANEVYRWSRDEANGS
jgi:hypothetical protein